MGGKRKDDTCDAPGSGMRFERADLGGLAPAQGSAAGGGILPGYRLPVEAVAVALVVLT